MYNILLVDDEPLVRKGIIHSINWDNFGIDTILEANDGMEAWDICQNQQIDILITDIKMPYMNGIELLRCIKEENRRTVKIVLSGYSDFDYLQKAIRAGVTDYVLKPINKDELEGVLETAIDGMRSEAYQRESYPEYLRNLKENTFSRLMEGNIGKAELKDKLDKLSLYIGRGGFTVVLFQFPKNIFETPDFFNTLQQNVPECEQIMRQENAGFAFANMNGNLVALYDNGFDNNEVAVINKKIASYLYRNFKTEVRIFVGKEVEEVEEISFSYMDAKRQRDLDKQEQKEEKKYSKLVADLLSFTEEHFTEDITLKEIAEKFYVNASYLGYVFKKEYGRSYSENINRKRITYAKELLQTTNMKVYEVAEKVGFIDNRYFVRVFKKYEGINPSNIRKG